MALGKNEILDGMISLIQNREMTALEGHAILTRELIAKLMENKQSGGQLDNSNNDRHDELQQEVLRMIETKTPPNGERYNARVKKGSKKENAKEFLLRVYAKFTKPVNEATDSPFPLQEIYQDQIGKIDKELLVGINQYARDHDKKTSDFLLPKASRNDLAISKLKFDLSINKKTIGMISSRIRKKNNSI